MTNDLSERTSRDALISVLESAGAVFHGNECKCMFHDDKRASAGIYERDGHWRFKCHSCEVSGDVFDIRARLSGHTVGDVLREGTSTKAPRPAATQPAAKSYKTIDELAKAQFWPVVATYYYTSTFAVLRLRKPDGAKTFIQCHRNGSGWANKAPAGLHPLYNVNAVRDADLVIVVEGEKDVDSLAALDIPAVTSVMGAGMANGKGKAHLSDWRPLAGKRVCLWPDNDNETNKFAGQKHMDDIAEILERLDPPCIITRLDPAQYGGIPPKGDVSDLLALVADRPRAIVRAAILAMIGETEPRPASAEVEELIETAISGKRVSLPLPWKRLTELAASLLPQSITLLCGAPGSGKSFLLLQVLYHLHVSGIKVALFTLEEDRADSLSRLLAQLSGNANIRDPQWLKQNPDPARDILDTYRAELDGFASRVYDAPDKQPSLKELAAWVGDRCAEGCRVVVLDPISIASTGKEPWHDAEQFLFAARAAVREHNASLVVVTHPRKGAHLGKLPVDLDNVAGGAALTRFSQTCLWLESHRDGHRAKIKGSFGISEIPSGRTIHILKSRNGPGQFKRVAMAFDKESLTFHEIGVIEHDGRNKPSVSEFGDQND